MPLIVEAGFAEEVLRSVQALHLPSVENMIREFHIENADPNDLQMVKDALIYLLSNPNQMRSEHHWYLNGIKTGVITIDRYSQVEAHHYSDYSQEEQNAKIRLSLILETLIPQYKEFVKKYLLMIAIIAKVNTQIILEMAVMNSSELEVFLAELEDTPPITKSE